MTLIVALRCDDDGIPGIVICADSQETITFQGREYKVSRLKIKPKRCGNFDIAIAGSGSNGDVIDGAVEHIHDAVASSSIKTLAEVKPLIQSQLLQYRKDEAAVHPKHELQFTLLICARSEDPEDVQAWTTKASRLEPLSDDPPFLLLGWDERLYQHELLRAYPKPRSAMQATILGLHVLSIAKQTSSYVDSPFRVVIAQANGMWREEEDVVSELEKRLSLFAPMLADLLLSCPDTTMKSKDFVAKLQAFEATMLQFRADYIQAEGDRFLKKMSSNAKHPFPHLLVPKGSIVHFRRHSPTAKVTFEVDEDEQRTARERKKFRELIEWAEKMGIEQRKRH